ncbi:MAG: ATP-binding protein, partial [Rhodospirillaceae bacterium]|nr:ATP-binding protein [Rhodospirillaceae bacterium]
RALAAGDLHTRVGGPKRRWADEVSVLSNDFDRMAERIQALITGKETLLRDVSHELRSPLARIRMALALAQRRANDEAQPDLERIERDAERLDDLIGQIMNLSRLRTQQAPRREPLSFDALVQTVVDDARYEYPEATVKLESAGPCEVLADRVGLRSAVDNVIRNALHYAGDAGPIEVTIEATAEQIVLRVADCGPGVSEDDLTRIFEPLYRVDPSRDHRGVGRGISGQGIGLAITARVMELHDGRAVARNRAGGGLEVTLRLPAGL